MSSKTKQLARKLGLLPTKRKRPGDADNEASLKRRRKGQLLSYVIVIDFESTCWKDKKGAEEIIEFPAVLLELFSGDLVSEFQQYVLPLENPQLSDFCKQLTGITQEQVDAGVPLPTCLRLFRQWVGSVSQRWSMLLMEPGHQYSEELNLCALATWSDWDLGVCLNYECRRKQVTKPHYMNQWIDIRALYKTFYERRPSGLAGALQDVGIKFSGREHCGLDDARNTASLCYRMAKDGCKLIVTKCISKAQAMIIKRPDECEQDTTSSEQRRKCDPVLEATSSVVTVTAPQCATPASVCGEQVNNSSWGGNDFSEEFLKELESWEEKCSDKGVDRGAEVVSKCVSHVAPVTVLQQGKHCTMDPHLQSSHKKMKSKEQPCSHFVADSKQPPIQLHQIATSTPSPSTGKPRSLGSFRTPSTAEWMKAKHTPVNSSSAFSTAFGGGKVTPPLCDCGKRARRKTTANSGPNDGKHFYVCPSGKASSSTHGCGFFRWEQSNSTDVELSSDY